MQCWPQPAKGMGSLCRRAGRRLALDAQSKLKYKTNIAQNHKRKSVWINIDYDRLYSQPSYNPGRQVGPVKLQQLPGRGRGLLAERQVPHADTLLLCEPVCGGVVTGPAGTDLTPPVLAERLAAMQAEGQLGPADRARLRLLHDGSAPDSPSSQRARGASLDDFRRLEDKLRRAADVVKKPKDRGFGAAPAAPAAAAAAEAAPRVDMAELGEAPLTAEELCKLVLFNAWGDAAGDMGATALRKEEPQAIIGVWPEFALLNHSCAPNTVAFAVGQLLVVQAARAIPAGSELSTCYLGDLVTAPLERRREWLRNTYGFECGCERCQAEAAVPPEVSAAVSAAYEAASSESALALVSSAPGGVTRGGLRGLQEQLSGAVGRLEEAMEAAGLEAQVRTWLRASAYDALFALAMIRDLPESGADLAALLREGLGGGAGGGGGGNAPFSDPDAPAQLAEVVQAVAPGSDRHLFLAIEALTRAAERYGRDDPRVAEATKACLRAQLTRYGRVSDAVLQRLLMARVQTRHYLGRVLPSGDEPSNGGGGGSQAGASSAAVPLLGAAGVASAAQLRQAAEDLAAGLV